MEDPNSKGQEISAPPPSYFELQNNQSGPYSPPSGPYPAQPGPYPAQPGPYPAQPGPYPAQPGPYPAQPGPYPAQPGPYPAQPGPYPAQPGPYSNQQLVIGNPGHTVVVQPVVRAQSYLGLSIFACLCCCFPVGIAAIVFAVQSQDTLRTGNVIDAREKGLTARKLACIAIGIGSVIYVICSSLRFVVFKY